MKKIVAVAFIILWGIFPTFAQNERLGRIQENVRIIKDKPTIYISFERLGRREPLKTGESNQGVWLRIHNNTNWSITFSAFGVPHSLGDMGVYYEIEAEPEISLSDVPIGYRPIDVYSTIVLHPKESVGFSVPREHLAKGLGIYVKFNYEWEKRKGYVNIEGEPEHRVYFRYLDLPKKVQ